MDKWEKIKIHANSTQDFPILSFISIYKRTYFRILIKKSSCKLKFHQHFDNFSVTLYTLSNWKFQISKKYFCEFHTQSYVYTLVLFKIYEVSIPLLGGTRKRSWKVKILPRNMHFKNHYQLKKACHWRVARSSEKRSSRTHTHRNGPKSHCPIQRCRFGRSIPHHRNNHLYRTQKNSLSTDSPSPPLNSSSSSSLTICDASSSSTPSCTNQWASEKERGLKDVSSRMDSNKWSPRNLQSSRQSCLPGVSRRGFRF